jgi:hypothetical protein
LPFWQLLRPTFASADHDDRGLVIACGLVTACKKSWLIKSESNDIVCATALYSRAAEHSSAGARGVYALETKQVNVRQMMCAAAARAAPVRRLNAMNVPLKEAR